MLVDSCPLLASCEKHETLNIDDTMSFETFISRESFVRVQSSPNFPARINGVLIILLCMHFALGGSFQSIFGDTVMFCAKRTDIDRAPLFVI